MAKNDLYIGNTDHDWFEFCAAHSEFQQVNFWQPSPQIFKAIEEGGIFFFRRKSPINKIGGFGRLASAHTASIGLLWDELGQSNGVTSIDDFINRVKLYTKKTLVDRITQVGFKIIIDQVFLDKKDWFDLPPDWSPNIVSGKSYSSFSDSGRYLMEQYHKHHAKLEAKRYTFSEKPLFGFSEVPQAGFTIGKSKIRIGQSAFRINVLSAYDFKCAVTGCDVVELLDSAHLSDFAATLNHSTTNGIALRSDIHRLVDRNLAYFSGDFSFHLCNGFAEQFPNSHEYHALDGKKIRLPTNEAFWPQFSLTSQS